MTVPICLLHICVGRNVAINSVESVANGETGVVFNDVVGTVGGVINIGKCDAEASTCCSFAASSSSVSAPDLLIEIYSPLRFSAQQTRKYLPCVKSQFSFSQPEYSKRKTTTAPSLKPYGISFVRSRFCNFPQTRTPHHCLMGDDIGRISIISTAVLRISLP